MRSDMRFDREQGVTLAGAAMFVLVCGTATALALGALSDANYENEERRVLLERFEAAHRRGVGVAGRAHEAIAPAAAFLDAPTMGQANAQLQAYVTRRVASQRASLASSGVQPSTRSDAADAIRLQVSFETSLPALQTLLYELETGTPYVFVEALSIRPHGPARAAEPLLRVTLNLRALWRRTRI